MEEQGLLFRASRATVLESHPITVHGLGEGIGIPHVRVEFLVCGTTMPASGLVGVFQKTV